MANIVSRDFNKSKFHLNQCWTSEKEWGFIKKPPILISWIAHKNGKKLLKKIDKSANIKKDREKKGTDSLTCKNNLRWGDAQKQTDVSIFSDLF